MTPAAGKGAVVLLVCRAVCCADEPAEVLERFLAKIEAELQRLPDHVCTQQIERFARGMNEGPWKREDTLTFTVGLAAGREIYSLPGGASFEDSELASAARRGVISSGQFGLMARHVFAWKAAKIGYRGESERAGRKAYEYEYDVPKEKSTYALRMGGAGDIVAFQGSFHVDAETLDLLELTVQAYDIPEKVGLAQADTKVTYSRVDVRGLDALLPSAATLHVTTADGIERLNRARFGECKRFEAESALIVEEEKPKAPVVAESRPWLPPGTMLELQLDMDLTPHRLKQGDPVRARLAKPVERPEGKLLPAGSIVHGVVGRLRSEDVPFPIYEIGLEFTGVESEGVILPVKATLVDVEGERGVIRESRRFMPTFSKKQRPRLDVLVREVQPGQGILLWDAKRPAIPKGLRMRWRVSEDATLRAKAQP
jgi:hypothetical protein